MWWFLWGYNLGCKLHMQLSLTHLDFHDRNVIEHSGSTLVLISSSYWGCIFSMTEMNVRNVMSRVINWECSCNPVAPFAMYIPLLWFHGSLWYQMIRLFLVWQPWSLGHWSSGTKLQELLLQPQLIAVPFRRTAQESCDLSELLCRLDPEHVPWACTLFNKRESFSEPCRIL